MAISDSFSLSQATISSSYAYKCWYNYNYGGKTMGISEQDISKITNTWNSELTKWRKSADNTKDETGNVEVYASIYDPEDPNSRLEPIETEKEWKVIETILETLQEEVRKKVQGENNEQ